MRSSSGQGASCLLIGPMLHIGDGSTNIGGFTTSINGGSCCVVTSIEAIAGRSAQAAAKSCNLL